MNISKYFLILFSILAAACNQPENKDADAPATTQTEEQQLTSAIKKFPDSMLLKENLIQYYRDNNNYAVALQETNNFIREDSSNARFWKIKAILHFESADTLLAIQAFEKAIQRYPQPADLISLGTLYAQTKNAKALSLSDTLLARFKTETERQAIYIKGLYYSFTGKKEMAITYFDQSLALNFTYLDAYREKAIALYDLARYKEALAVLDRAVTLQNNFDEGYFYKGRCLEKLNQPEEAIEAYQTALMYSPDYEEAKEALNRLGAAN